MTHSWPPPLSAIHTPGKAEQSKFPFPNKVRHSASCRNIPPAPHNMSWLSVWGVWAEVDAMVMIFSMCVCQYSLSIPHLFPSYSLSRATQSAPLGSRIDGGGDHRFLMARQNHSLWWDVQMGWLLLRLLTDTFGHRQQWEVRELLLASIPPVSFGFTSWDFCWNLWGLRKPSLVHWPLVGPEDWLHIFCHQPGFKGAAL